jgi:hypothetical protein
MKNRLSSSSGIAAPRNAGIAIGPILFVVALLGIIAGVMASAGGGFTTAGQTDTAISDLRAQISLIRGKISECNMMAGSKEGECPAETDRWPKPAGTALGAEDTTPALVSDIECPCDPSGEKNLWTGVRNLQMPPPPKNFGPWYYVNAKTDGGGICMRIQPVAAAASGAAIKEALAKVATYYRATEEIEYDPGSVSQRLIVWIKRPTGVADAGCTI